MRNRFPFLVTLTVVIALWAVPSSVLGNTIPSSTMIFQGTLTDNGDGTYTGVVAMIDEGGLDSGYDIYGEEGANAWFGNDPGSGPVWTSQLIGADHDAWLTWSPDTPDWYQYSLDLYEDAGVQKWAVRNHAGATEANPWYDEAFWGVGGLPARGVPMSGVMNWTSLFAAETEIGAYLPGTGTPEIPGGAAGYGGGAGAWDMDWSWGSEAVPLELAGFDVDVQSAGGGIYDVTLTPADPEEVWVDDNFNASTPGWGVTHFASIQDGIDAVSGSLVNVAAGIYTEYVHIVGDGLSLLGAGIDQTIIDLDGLMPYWHYLGCSSSYASRAGLLISGYGEPDEISENITIMGLTVRNAGLNPPGGGSYPEFVDPGGDGQDDVRGIGVHNGRGILIQNCKVEGSGYNGIGVGKARCTTLQQSEDVTITGCVSINNCNTGITVGNYTGAITITNNTCSGNKMPWGWYDPDREYAGKGIEVIGSSSAQTVTGIISGNTCAANGYQGITLKGYTDGVIVESDTVTGHNLDDDGAGIFFYATSSTPSRCINTVVRNNTLSGNIRGIIGYYTQDATITGNTIATASGAFDSGQDALKLDGCNGATVSGNELISCDGNGIKVQNTWDGVESFNNDIDGNTITDPAGPGIKVSSGAHDNTFTGNSVTGAQFAGIFIYMGACDNTFSDNEISGVTTSTFYAGEDYEVTQGDGVFLWGYNNDFDARAGSGNAFTGNAIYACAGDGMENQVNTFTVDASGNWWGTSTPSGVDSEISDYVDYTPWCALNGTYDNPGFTADLSELWVDDDSPQSGATGCIQEGVNLVSGSTVNVADGSYGADPATGKGVYITKDGISLIGESESGAVIDGAIGGVGASGSYWPKGIHVQAENVTVQNFTVKGFTGDLASSGGYGVLHRDYAHDTPGEGYIFYDGCTLDKVTVQDCYSAVYALCFPHLTVSNCTVADNYSDGMFIARGCDYADIHDNVVTNSGDHGIWVGKCWSGLDPSDNAVITGNTVNGAREGGISFVGSDGATIEGNAITNVAGEGWSIGALSLKDGPSNVTARYNVIYGNDGTWGGYNGTGHGIGIDGTPSNIVLNWNSIYDNAGYGCYNYSTVTVDAKHCWWGDASGPNAGGKGTGDEVTSHVDYDPWIGKSGSENIVFVSDPENLTNGSPAKTISVEYLGGGGGLVYGYNVSFTWDGGVVSTSAAQVTQGNLLTDQGTTNFFVNQVGNTITVNTALEGAQPGVTGPGTMFTIDFSAVACGSSVINLTVNAVRDNNNQPLGGFYEDDGLINVDTGLPVFTVNGPASGECYAAAPVLDLSASDACSDLDDAFYKVDAGAWQSEANLFTDYAGAAWSNATWTLPGFAGLGEGSHTVYFYCTDDFGNESATASWDFIKDTDPPDPVTGFASAPGNGKTHLSWTNPGSDFDHVVVVRKAWGSTTPYGYPDYYSLPAPLAADGYPVDSLDGVVVYSGTASSYDDSLTDRSIYFYHAFVYDCANNWTGGTPPTGNIPDAFAQGDRTTNYWLGDVAAPYDGKVGFSDISALSTTYWLTEGDGGWNDQCDVGPTDDWSRVGLPLPDDVVDFEDLIIFSMNIDVVDPSGKTMPPVLLAGEKTAANPTLRLEGAPAGKGLYEVRLVLDGNVREVKGASIELRFNEEALSYASAAASDALVKSRAFFIADQVARGLVKIDLAALGMDRTIEGSGEIARVTFHASDVSGELGLRFGDVVLRGAGNAKLTASIDDIALSQGVTVPSVTRLVGAVPNPFNPTTAVAYELSAPERVSVNIYDAQGRLVRTLVDQSQSAGHYEAIWNGRDNAGRACASGVYLVRMVAGEYGKTAKMVMLK